MRLNAHQKLIVKLKTSNNDILVNFYTDPITKNVDDVYNTTAAYIMLNIGLLTKWGIVKELPGLNLKIL